MRHYAIFVLFCFLWACSHGAQQRSEQLHQVRSGKISSAQAIVIAENVARGKNPQLKELISKAKLNNGEWHILVQFVMGYDKNGNPLFMIGGDCMVILDGSGNLKNYFEGE